MVAYLRRAEPQAPKRRALSHEMFHGLTPAEFDKEAQELANAEAMTPAVRARLKAQLVESLKTPVDAPSWGPDWIRKSERAKRKTRRYGLFALLAPKTEKSEEPARPLSKDERDDAQVIARNMEKSRQVAHYRWLYALAIGLAVAIALLAMFVDYQIIRGDIWTRALSNEFMVVPASLQSSVVFKSMQVIFAVLIVHFMLKITGVYGRNSLITTAFVLSILMIGCLGYLVAYNNMAGATSASLEQTEQSAQPPANSIDQLFDSLKKPAPATPAIQAGMINTDEVSLPLPKISKRSLANADSWFWLVFASVIFFIVTSVAALYLLSAESNVRNFLLSRDYKHRQKQFAQLHLLELAERKPA
jgi:hypothetical protein